MDTISLRDQQIMLERENGNSLHRIAREYGISYERVRQVVIESADTTAYLNRLELDLMVAAKEGKPLKFEKSFRDLLVVLDRLVLIRGLDIQVSINHSDGALTILLEDKTNDAQEEE